jgi:HEPN domain-containing protein
MINVHKQTEYWRTGAQEDWDVAWICIENGKARHGLFLARLALEKILKAHICRCTKSIPPRIHDLGKLFELGQLPSGMADYERTLDRVNQFNIEGRYPETLPPAPMIEEAKRVMKQAKDVYLWLTSLL